MDGPSNSLAAAGIAFEFPALEVKTKIKIPVILQ
jgi:hypothetical protein